MDWSFWLPTVDKAFSDFSAKDWLDLLDSVAWGPIMIVLLVGTGIYLTFRMGLLQFRGLGHSIACISGKYDDPKEKGDITHFQALSAALSATIGVGNIAGVATAIAAGGPGAVFWMWITALVGMATKYTSCSLAVKYRKIHEDGSASGGPMWFLSLGFPIKSIGKVLAFFFALFALIASFGIGNMTQANSVMDGLKPVIQDRLPDWWMQTWQLMGHPIEHYKLVFGVLLAVLVGIVIVGGIRRIAQVASRIVPFMSVVYVAGALVLLVMNWHRVPGALGLIFRHAFTPYAAGGGVAGFAISQAIRFGVARGVFSNESGLGSAPMAHGAAKTGEPAREGFVAMLGPFIDTIIICTMTALVILVADVFNTIDPATGKVFTSASLTAESFRQGLGTPGRWIVSFGLVFFAYSTMISWSYYGDRCAEYLFGRWAIMPYRIIYTCVIVVGAVGALQVIWTLADIFNALMAIPNLIGLIVLSGVTVRYTRSYLARLWTGQIQPPAKE